MSQGISTALLLKNSHNGGPPVFPVTGDTPASTPEQVSFILKTRNQGLLELQASTIHGHYLSTQQFARIYGQSSENILALQSYLAHYHITTTVMADGLDVQATGHAGDFDKALGTHQRDYQMPAVPARWGNKAIPARKFHGSATNPLLPRQLASFVLAVLGLSNYPTYSSDAVQSPQYVGKTLSVKPAATDNPPGERVPSDFANDYNLPAGDGHGSTIGIVTLAALDTTSPYLFWNNLLNLNVDTNRITVDNVDGGPGEVSDSQGSGESTLDVEQSGALAPKAKIIVYQAPNTDPGFLDAFFQAASDNQADSVSASWGEAETVINYFVKSGTEDPAYQQTFDEAFLEMAVQGQSAFASSGDAGAYDDSDELGTTNLDVDSPGNSPWVISSGGTTLPSTFGATNITQERAWSWDYLWPYWSYECSLFNTTNFPPLSFPNGPPDCTLHNWIYYFTAAGGGGGYSSLESMPLWQRAVGATHYSAVQYLTPTAFVDTGVPGFPQVPTDWNINLAPSVQTGTGNGRGEPDLSADADPETGYLLLFSFGSEPNNTQPPSLEGGWGGTSFVAPQLNGSTAVMDSNLGHRVGLWGPQIYGFAASNNSPFTPLDSNASNTDQSDPAYGENENNNLFYTGTQGAIWNPATGLGTPDLSKLQSDFGH